MIVRREFACWFALRSIAAATLVLAADADNRSVRSTDGQTPAAKRANDFGFPEVALINTDGSNVKTLVRGSPNGSFAVGVWSPTGSHLLVRYFDHFLQDHYLLRMMASGSGKTRLTGRNAYPAVGYGPIPTGWRE